MKLGNVRVIDEDINAIKELVNTIRPESQSHDYYHTVNLRYATWEFILELLNTAEFTLKSKE